MEPTSCQRILVRSPNWLGDAIMAVPALEAWRAHRDPSCHTAVIAPANLVPFWKHIPGIETIFVADRNPFITASSIRSWQADGALILPNSPRSALEAYLAAIPCRMGFTGKWRHRILTHTFNRPLQVGSPHHQSLDSLDLLKAFLLIPKNTALPRINLPLPERPKSPESDYLLVCPGAEYGPAKRWPVDRYAQVANTLAASSQLHVVIAGAENDQNICAALTEKLRVPHTNTAGTTPLSEFLSLCAHARLILCNDSGAMHVASLFNTPGVAIFGSTEPAWTGPISRSITALREDVPCSPCFLRECPIDFRCMIQISTASVLEACQIRLS